MFKHKTFLVRCKLVEAESSTSESRYEMSSAPKFPLVTTDHWNIFSKERNRSAKRRLQGPVSYRQDEVLCVLE